MQRPPCRFFQVGQCSAGASCKFSHIKTVQASVDVVCKFWAAGNCVHGDKCPFRHARKTASAPRPAAPLVAPPPPRPRPPPPPNEFAALDLASLDAMAPVARDQRLGTIMYPRIVSLVGDGLAGKLTGMLLQMPNAQLLQVLDSPAALRGAVDRAVGVLPAAMLESLRVSSPSPPSQPAASVASAASAASAAPTAPVASIVSSADVAQTPPRPPAPPTAATTATGAAHPRPSDSECFRDSADAAVRSIAPRAEELRASAQLSCGVCLEPVLARRGRFGLLEGCEHTFCIDCLRSWRSTHAIRPDVARSCPECRAPSHFVVPSSVHLIGERKAALTAAYLANLRAIPCRHFNYGEGTCPFGSSCFYAHTDRHGKPVVLQPRRAVGASGVTVLPEYRLSDYLFPESAHGELATDALLATIPLAPEGGEEGGGEESGVGIRGHRQQQEDIDQASVTAAVDLS